MPKLPEQSFKKSIENKENLDLTPEIEKILSNPFVEPLPIIPNKVGEFFPAIVHAFHSARGRIYDKGWKIKWFNNEEEAKKRNEKYKKEAESLYLTKDFFQNLEGVEEQKLPELIYPKIDVDFDKNEIIKYGGIEKYKFVGKAITYVDASLEGWMHRDEPAKLCEVYHDFLFKDGELLISTQEERGSGHGARHYYDVAIKNGADKEKLDQKMIETYNSKVEQIKQKIKEQFGAIDFDFLKDYNNLPKLAGGQIHLKEAIEKCGELLNENYSVNTIEEYWDAHVPSGYVIDELNNQFIQWNKFWKGSFGLFNKKIEEKEILVNYGGNFRRMGRTGCKDYWVIQSNGDIRPPTSIEYRKDYFDEGEKNWDVVISGEIAISWSKSNTGADHYFEINKIPEKLTNEQKNSIKLIQNELETEWEGRVGMSGKTSPPIGEGWSGLLGEGRINNDGDTELSHMDDAENTDSENNNNNHEETPEQKLQALKDKFEKK